MNIYQDLISQSELILSLTMAQLKARYRKTYAGLVWVLVNPILTFWVQAIIFKIILKVDIAGYYVFLLTGIVPWIFITSSLVMTSGLFVNHRNALLALKFDPKVLLSSQILDNFINYVLSFFILSILIQNKNLLSFPVLGAFLLNSLLLLAFIYSLTFFVAIINVFFRDTQYILQFALGLLYFVTPIFYPRELLDSYLNYVVDFNIFYIFIELFQTSMWNEDYHRYGIVIMKAILAILTMTGITTLLWSKARHRIYLKL